MSSVNKKFIVKIISCALLLVILIAPSFVSAAWWNPFSWNIWQKITNIFYKPQVVQVQQEKKVEKENKGKEIGEEQKTKNDKVLLEDVYPLYGNLKWGPITPKKAEGVEPIDGLETKAESMVSGMQEGDKFFGYYENKLVKLGWEQDGNFAADGMTGSQTGYKKGENKIVLKYGLSPGKIISGKNEPLQYACPCKMTYSIFTTIPKDETANWKTYRNTEYGFEIKYPLKWEIISGGVPTYENSIVTNISGPEGGITIEYGGKFWTNCSPSTCEKTKIGGRDVYLSNEIVDSLSENWAMHMEHKNYGLHIYATAASPNTKNRDIILKIFSTFKFIK